MLRKEESWRLEAGRGTAGAEAQGYRDKPPPPPAGGENEVEQEGAMNAVGIRE